MATDPTQAKAPTVLFFTPQPLRPTSTGFHRRCLQFIDAYHTVGCRVVVCGFGEEARVSAVGDAGELPDSARTLSHDPDGRRPVAARVTLRLMRAVGRHDPPAWTVVTNDMRAWFNRIVESERPDIVHFNYTRWSRLLAGVRREPLRVVDLNDLLSFNDAMRYRLQALLRDERVGADHPNIDLLTSQDFFSHAGIGPEKTELRACDRFDLTIAISRAEAELVKAGTARTRVLLAPATATPIEATTTSSSHGAVFVASDNPFNVQGYLFLVHRVLPVVLASEPAFRLQVTGTIARRVNPAPGVELLGRVEDLAEVYRNNSFALCPLLGGTGEKVKIVEAMAYGLPVIALPAAAEGSPIVDGLNGAVARDASAFATTVLHWWNNSGLCRQLGREAQVTVRRDRGPDLLAAIARQLVLAAGLADPNRAPQ